jgi:hypothetical protein
MGSGEGAGGDALPSQAGEGNGTVVGAGEGRGSDGVSRGGGGDGSRTPSLYLY